MQVDQLGRNLTVDTATLHVDASGSKVGIKTKSPDAELHVVGNAYVSSNLTVDTDTLHVDSVNKRVGIETKKDLILDIEQSLNIES